MSAEFGTRGKRWFIEIGEQHGSKIAKGRRECANLDPILYKGRWYCASCENPLPGKGHIVKKGNEILGYCVSRQLVRERVSNIGLVDVCDTCGTHLGTCEDALIFRTDTTPSAWNTGNRRRPNARGKILGLSDRRRRF